MTPKIRRRGITNNAEDPAHEATPGLGANSYAKIHVPIAQETLPHRGMKTELSMSIVDTSKVCRQGCERSRE